MPMRICFFVNPSGEEKPERLKESLFSRKNIKLVPDPENERK